MKSKKVSRVNVIFLSADDSEVSLRDALLDFWEDVASVVVDGRVYEYAVKASNISNLVFLEATDKTIINVRTFEELESYRF